jgi:hypothetical protein
MRTRSLVPVGLVVLLVGCVPIVSLHPLASRETVVFQDRLLGTWELGSGDLRFEFRRLEEPPAEDWLEELPADPNQLYRLSVTNEEGGKGVFVAGLVRLDDRLFLDVFTDRFPSGEREPEDVKLVFNTLLFIPGHTFARLEFGEGELRLCWTDDDEFGELIADDPDAIGHAVVGDRPVLTAPTTALQRFVRKHAGDDRLFATEFALERVTEQ